MIESAGELGIDSTDNIIQSTCGWGTDSTDNMINQLLGGVQTQLIT